MGFLSDIFFGPSPSTPTPPRKVQDWEKGYQRLDGSEVVQDEPKQTSSSREEEVRDPYHDESGNKIRPEVEIERIKANFNADMKHVELWAVLKNLSEFNIEVTRINLLGQHAAGRFLDAGESFELRIYSGDTPTSESYRTAEVQYKIVDSGDYFQADHYIEYDYEENEHGKFYIPSECKITRPVKDI